MNWLLFTSQKFDKFDKVAYNKPYSIDEEQFRMTIPAYALYDNYTIQYAKNDTILKGNHSVIHTIEPYYLGIDKNCEVSIKTEIDTIADKTKYYIASINSVGKNKGKVSQTYISSYNEGWLTAQVKTFGQFVVKADLEKLKEQFRFSDPVSSDATKEIEGRIQEMLQELKNLAVQGSTEEIRTAIENIALTLTERNRICKANK